MIVLFHREFKKRYRTLPEKTKKRFKERLGIFVVDEHNPILENHALSGTFKGYRSINITGDFRTIYKVIDAQTVEFALIGTHSELYG